MIQYNGRPVAGFALGVAPDEDANLVATARAIWM